MGNTNSHASNKQHQFKAHIAIDFGTDGCGLAFAYNGNVTVYNKWKAKKRQRVVKAPTQILLNDKDEVIAFGNNAKIMYSNLTGIEKKEWKFFERFKMSLYGDHLIGDDDENNDDEKKASTGYVWSTLSTVGGYAYSCGSYAGSYAPKKWQKTASKLAKKVADNSYYDSHGMYKKHVINPKEFHLKAVNGKQCPANVIFVAVFEHLAQIAKEHLGKITNDAKINDDEIQWIVTVPAIWSTKSIRKMRKWMIKAGLTKGDNKNQCKIVYEPDCAALAIYQDLKENKNINNKEKEIETKIEDQLPSDKYILIDAGGGTVDIACHEILRDKCLSVQEVHYPTGGKWGGCFINDQYIKLLEAIFTKQWMDEFKDKSPNVYVEIIDNFQNAKTLFFENPNVDTPHPVELPYEFMQFLDEKDIDNKLEQRINEIRKKDISYFKQKIFDTKTKKEDTEDEENKEAVPDEEEDEFSEASCVLILSDTDESLIIDFQIWKCIFDSIIDDIIDHIKQLLKEESLQKGCNHLYLVGGMACSQYYQHKIKQSVGEASEYKLNVIIPPNPTLMVVRGAAYFGITDNYIKARILKHSYGIGMSLDPALATQRGISKKYIQEKTNYSQKGLIKNCFTPFFRKNERVPIRETRTLEVVTNENTEYTVIPIFQIDMENPKIISNEKPVRELRICHERKRKVIKLECTFNDTGLMLFYYMDNIRMNEEWVWIDFV